VSSNRRLIVDRRFGTAYESGVVNAFAGIIRR
jgi:hypothetical protein